MANLFDESTLFLKASDLNIIHDEMVAVTPVQSVSDTMFKDAIALKKGKTTTTNNSTTTSDDIVTLTSTTNTTTINGQTVPITPNTPTTFVRDPVTDTWSAVTLSESPPTGAATTDTIIQTSALPTSPNAKTPHLKGSVFELRATPTDSGTATMNIGGNNYFNYYDDVTNTAFTLASNYVTINNSVNPVLAGEFRQAGKFLDISTNVSAYLLPVKSSQRSALKQVDYAPATPVDVNKYESIQTSLPTHLNGVLLTALPNQIGIKLSPTSFGYVADKDGYGYTVTELDNGLVSVQYVKFLNGIPQPPTSPAHILGTCSKMVNYINGTLRNLTTDLNTIKARGNALKPWVDGGTMDLNSPPTLPSHVITNAYVKAHGVKKVPTGTVGLYKTKYTDEMVTNDLALLKTNHPTLQHPALTESSVSKTYNWKPKKGSVTTPDFTHLISDSYGVRFGDEKHLQMVTTSSGFAQIIGTQRDKPSDIICINTHILLQSPSNVKTGSEWYILTHNGMFKKSTTTENVVIGRVIANAQIAHGRNDTKLAGISVFAFVDGSIFYTRYIGHSTKTPIVEELPNIKLSTGSISALGICSYSVSGQPQIPNGFIVTILLKTGRLLAYRMDINTFDVKNIYVLSETCRSFAISPSKNSDMVDVHIDCQTALSNTIPNVTINNVTDGSTWFGQGASSEPYKINTVNGNASLLWSGGNKRFIYGTNLNPLSLDELVSKPTFGLLNTNTVPSATTSDNLVAHVDGSVDYKLDPYTDTVKPYTATPNNLHILR